VRLDRHLPTASDAVKQTYYYYYIRLTALFRGQPDQAGTRKANQSEFYWSKR